MTIRVALLADGFGGLNGVTEVYAQTLPRLPSEIAVIPMACRDIGLPFWRLRHIGRVRTRWIPEVDIALPSAADIHDALVSLDADLIHVTAPGPLGWRGAGVARKLGIPIVASFHTDLVAYVALSSRVLARAVELPTRRLYGRADVVTAPTPRAAQALARVLHSDSGAIRIVPQGVDPARFARAPAARRPGHQSRILTVSRLSPEKRLDLLIDSVRRLGDARLDVVGDGPLRQRLSRSAPDVELHGALTGNDLVAAFRSADIFALASPTETCGQVLLEAQAAGLACVVSPSGGARDAVLPGQTAVVARENSPAAFAEALATALADRERLGREARRFALAQTWERTAEALTSCYADAVAVAVARSDSRGFRDRPG